MFLLHVGDSNLNSDRNSLHKLFWVSLTVQDVDSCKERFITLDGDQTSQIMWFLVDSRLNAELTVKIWFKWFLQFGVHPFNQVIMLHIYAYARFCQIVTQMGLHWQDFVLKRYSRYSRGIKIRCKLFCCKKII